MQRREFGRATPGAASHTLSHPGGSPRLALTCGPGTAGSRQAAPTASGSRRDSEYHGPSSRPQANTNEPRTLRSKIDDSEAVSYLRGTHSPCMYHPQIWSRVTDEDRRVRIRYSNGCCRYARGRTVVLGHTARTRRQRTTSHPPAPRSSQQEHVAQGAWHLVLVRHRQAQETIVDTNCHAPVLPQTRDAPVLPQTRDALRSTNAASIWPTYVGDAYDTNGQPFMWPSQFLILFFSTTFLFYFVFSITASVAGTTNTRCADICPRLWKTP